MITLNDLLALSFISKAFHRQDEKKAFCPWSVLVKIKENTVHGFSTVVEPEPLDLQLFALAESDLDPVPT
jgi:hypothetical protein